MITLMRVAPELPVDDMPEALEHYGRQLGFEVAVTMPDGDYAIVERDGVALHLFCDEAGSHTPGSIHIFVAGLDELFAELQSRQANITQAVVRQPWGNRHFRVVDCAGNTLKFTEPASKAH